MTTNDPHGLADDGTEIDIRLASLPAEPTPQHLIDILRELLYANNSPEYRFNPSAAGATIEHWDVQTRRTGLGWKRWSTRSVRAAVAHYQPRFPGHTPWGITVIETVTSGMDEDGWAWATLRAWHQPMTRDQVDQVVTMIDAGLFDFGERTAEL